MYNKCALYFISHAVSPYTMWCVSKRQEAPSGRGLFCPPQRCPVLARVEEGRWPAGGVPNTLDWRPGPLQNGCQKELLIMDALSQIQFGGCGAACRPHPTRLQERVLPPAPRHRQARAWPPWLASARAQKGEPVCRPAHLSGIPRWPAGSLLGCSVLRLVRAGAPRPGLE